MSLADFIIASVSRRKPDLQIGGAADPYMNRWYVIPRNRFFNIYLHQFIRDDEDRALHDHPWWSLSWLLRGRLVELLQDGAVLALEAPSLRLRSARMAHRLAILNEWRGDTWTLFITGPRIREWGFHCPKGWVHWQDFTAGAQGEIVGKGCGET
jgi:hypothetical protein